MAGHRTTPKPAAIPAQDIEDFLLERNPRFRAMLRRAKREPGGMTLARYRKSRKA